jgi:Protein of unknown function (DUF3592)
MAAVIALFGLLFAGAATVKMVRLAAVQSHGRRATGRVVRFEVVRNLTDQPTYAPVVEFEAGDRKLEVRGWASFPPGYVVGQEVAVYYSPDCPEKAQLVSGREWWIAWCFLAGGVAFVVFGIAIALQ